MSASLFNPVPKPANPLARYRLLSPSAGLHVSPLQFGAMSIGDKWTMLGHMDKEQSFKLLDAYFDAGGNFIDTANGYQEDTSEMFIGEWVEQRNIRNQLVIATKYTNVFNKHVEMQQRVNFCGNNYKSMYMSVEASLEKLRTTYIDILYVHFWDWETSVEEVMNGLHNLVVQGKVLYLGISDAPAWVVSKANTYARCQGKTPFVIYQGQWNVLLRDFEREIIPMARSEGLALAPWGVLAGGRLRTDAEEQRRRETGEKGRTLFEPSWERNENEKTMSAALEKVAKEIGAKSISAVAIAYIMQKAPYVFPIIGGRRVEQLQQNIDALEITLTPEHIKYLESVIPFNLGFPNNMIGDGTDHVFSIKSVAYMEKLPYPAPIKPSL